MIPAPLAWLARCRSLAPSRHHLFNPEGFAPRSPLTRSRRHVTTSTPRTRRSSTEIDSAMRPTMTISDTGQGVA